MKEIFGVLTMFIVIAVIVTCLLVATLAFAIDRPTCVTSTRDIGLPSRWSFWGGCQVEITDGRWIPLDNWYYVEK